MAMNPMQRRARNSFLIGFLVSLIIMAVVVVILLYRMKSLDDAKKALEAENKNVYVAASDLKSGDTIILDENFKMDTVRTEISEDEIISDDDFQFYDKDGNIVAKYNKEGEQIYKELVMRVNVPAGTIVTKDMFVESGNEITDSDRIMEFNMIQLPSQLKNGDYIDIRLATSDARDYIVLSKLKVLGCTDTSVWLKVNETELLTLNCAIIESYLMAGSKLYATQYIEAGMQDNLIPTYVVSNEVLALMNKDNNVLDKDEIRNRYEELGNQELRQEYFDSILQKYQDQRDSLVESGINDENEKIKAARQQFVESLEGTEDIGYER